MEKQESKLKSRREELSLTQKQVAEQVGISVQAYQQYEYGIKLPNVKLGGKIAKILSVTVEELYGD